MYNELYVVHIETAGLSLEYQLYDATNTAVGSMITTGFTDLTKGDYLLDGVMPDLFQGSIRIYNQVGNVYLASHSVNGETAINNSFSGSVSIPYDIWCAIMLWVADKYENREATGATNVIVPLGFEALVSMRGLTNV